MHLNRFLNHPDLPYFNTEKPSTEPEQKEKEKSIQDPKEEILNTDIDLLARFFEKTVALDGITN